MERSVDIFAHRSLPFHLHDSRILNHTSILCCCCSSRHYRPLQYTHSKSGKRIFAVCASLNVNVQEMTPFSVFIYFRRPKNENAQYNTATTQCTAKRPHLTTTHIAIVTIDASLQPICSRANVSESDARPPSMAAEFPSRVHLKGTIEGVLLSRSFTDKMV